MLDLETISAIIFVLAVIAAIIIDRKNIEFKSGLIMRRTKRGKRWLYETARKYKKLLYWTTTIGVFAWFVISVVTFGILGYSVYNMFANPELAVAQGPSSRLILPSIGGVQYPNFVLGVPIWFWIIGIFVVVSVHEPFHAFAARLKNISIKSMGLALLFIFPIAFVEPDDNQVKKLKPLSKMRIYAAGSFANLMVALITFLIIFGVGLLASDIFSSVQDGAMIISVAPNSPASEAGLTKFTTITEVDNQRVRNVTEFSDIMGKYTPNQTVQITTNDGVYSIRTIGSETNASRAIIGVNLGSDLEFSGILSGLGKPSTTFLYWFDWVNQLFTWLFVINLGVGSFNLLPVRFLDGGYLYETLLQKFFKDKVVKNIITVLSVAFLFLIIMSLLGPSILSLLIK
jgi:membrane-associated protease RseP (regulator of RpoE activity)